MFGVILSQVRWKGMKYEKVDSGFPLDLFDKKDVYERNQTPYGNFILIYH